MGTRDTIPVLSNSLTYSEDSISLRFSLRMDKPRELEWHQLFRIVVLIRGKWHSTEALKKAVQPDWGTDVTGSQSWAHTGKPWSASQMVCELDLQGSATLNCLVELPVPQLSLLRWLRFWLVCSVDLTGKSPWVKELGKYAHTRARSQIPMCHFHAKTVLWVEWQGRRWWMGPARENEWRPALPDGTGISVMSSHHGSPGNKNHTETPSWWCWGVSSGILHFGFHQILVPFSQIWMTNMSLLLNICGFRNLYGLFTGCWKSDLRIGF